MNKRQRKKRAKKRMASYTKWHIIHGQYLELIRKSYPELKFTGPNFDWQEM